MRIAKAYAALTNEESRKNWEEFGNPDGPEATKFGIALPKWIVERENSMWVLAVYGLVFMIILPVVVGVWWYRSIKFSGDKVLLDTTRLYYHFINKTPNMILKRAAMILGASCEFDRTHNAEIIERPTDNEELPLLIKQLQNVQEKNRERPLCFAYSVKARALMLAHFQRMPLNPDTLELDQKYLLKKCPYLINDMVNICASLVAMAMTGRVSQAPRLESMENMMKLSQMIIQGLDEKSSPLLQLPHLTPDMLRHFMTRKPVPIIKFSGLRADGLITLGPVRPGPGHGPSSCATRTLTRGARQWAHEARYNGPRAASGLEKSIAVLHIHPKLRQVTDKTFVLQHSLVPYSIPALFQSPP
ncbi:translocation protein SEC63 homolog [Elysia marginata]|uniref:Translocation protein SEC63 homolog n=1 Tax=Elysia marginata TaxID=1093978 RepID=A0AAV4FUQ4_9GAST|nr:translocation protein SEC63 homolog [Elysia marginata]